MSRHFKICLFPAQVLALASMFMEIIRLLTSNTTHWIFVHRFGAMDGSSTWSLIGGTLRCSKCHLHHSWLGVPWLVFSLGAQAFDGSLPWNCQFPSEDSPYINKISLLLCSGPTRAHHASCFGTRPGKHVKHVVGWPDFCRSISCFPRPPGGHHFGANDGAGSTGTTPTVHYAWFIQDWSRCWYLSLELSSQPIN